MALSDHVSISITQDTRGIARGDFGVPMFLSYNADTPFAGDRIRFYTSLAEVAEDFSSTTGPEYLFAQAAFSQDPHCEEIAIGRGALPATQKYLITVAAVRNSHDYEIEVKGDGVTSETSSYTSDSAATQQEIANGLLTDLNLVTGKNFTATFLPLVFSDITFQGEADDDTLTFGSAHGLQTGDGPVRVSGAGLPTGLSAGVDYYVVKVSATVINLATSLANALAGTIINLTTDGSAAQTLADTASTVSPYGGVVVTGDAAGEWFSLAVDVADLEISQTHVDPGVATDLAAILLESNEWYCLITGYNSNAYVIAAADWVEANSKIYLAEVNESDAVTTSAGNSDTLDDLATAEYARVAPVYHQEPAEFFSAALAGSRLSYDAGAETWKFANLSGVTPTTLTTTQRTNLVNRNANFYQNVAGLNVSQNGTMADGGFIDTKRFLDWLVDDMSASVFDALTGVPKVPYTDLGVAIIEGAMRGSLLRGVQRGGISTDPEFTVTAPKVADIDSADRAARLLPDMKFTATLAGAIHKVTISGTVSV